MTIRVGLIGCGAIGTTIALAIDNGEAGDIKLVIVYDIVRERAVRLANSLSEKPVVADSYKDVTRSPNVNLVVEAASQQAVRDYVSDALANGKDVMILSVGALSDPELLESLKNIARKYGRRIFIPSGAIAGIDGVKAAAIGGIEEVVLITRKPPKALADSPYIAEKGIKLEAISEPTMLYEGLAEDAIRKFPRNINVAMTLSLAGIGPRRTIVKVVADPTINRNIHEIRVRGRFGELTVVTCNVPSPMNPRTSYLAALSAIRMLKNLSEPILVGT